ncbi:cobalamin biosynthesis protein [Cognatishimia sp. SS12]|uniref:cobalamin biosynthesis protein n=1 Tax=Cognatishimia sp. SS12 TaxID=2979465 RepID=UPI0023311268|nr:cobalamin biosynthesis protein [Cognatishimia sp. SS12]MDC0736668.1 cobalamin biosynthesis protein [Cognatishimia sp. SS12]
MIIAGFGFRQEATASSLRDAYQRLGGDADAIAVLDDKAGALCFKQLAETLGLPVHLVTLADMQAMTTATQSAKVQEKRGTGSVAEACALAAAGAGARLMAKRHISGDRLATCALAQRTEK